MINKAQMCLLDTSIKFVLACNARMFKLLQEPVRFALTCQPSTVELPFINIFINKSIHTEKNCHIIDPLTSRFFFVPSESES